jgi:TPP-dependent pyruvate/acetoin dehydrogenase alpha subunit
MSHDSTKVVMGASTSNVYESSNKKGATVIEAGLVVRLKSDDTPSILAADGSLLGVSMGKDLSDTGRTVICRKGLGIPVKVATGFTPTIGAAVAISTTTGEAKAYTGTGDAYVNAVYKTAILTGLGEDAADKRVALIDFPGGL